MDWSHNKLVIAGVKKMDPEKLYSQLTWERENKGYKPTWILAKFKEIKGYWPPRWYSAAGVIPPDNELREYLGIMTNRWKQKKRREEAREELKRYDHSLIANELSPILKNQAE